MKLSTKQQEIYNEVFSIYPNDKDNVKLKYVNRYWIFPNHIDIVIDSSMRFIERYYPQANKEIVFLASLLHDTGLVYNRTKDDAYGHEERSIEYSKKILKKYKYKDQIIQQVIQAISATEPQNKTETIESKIVRTADAYSHFVSIHFFAKSNFTENWEQFIKWFSKKIDDTYIKLEIAEVKEEIRPIYNHYKTAVNIYITRNNKVQC